MNLGSMTTKLLGNRKMNNNSGYIPLRDAVLLKHIEAPIGALVLPDTVRDRSLMLEQKAEIIDYGPDCWFVEGGVLKVGDKVIIAKMAGYFAAGIDGERYRIVNDRDIFAKINGD